MYKYIWTYSCDDQPCPETFARVVVISRQEWDPSEDRSLFNGFRQDGVVNLGRRHVADVPSEGDYERVKRLAQGLWPPWVPDLAAELTHCYSLKDIDEYKEQDFTIRKARWM